LVVEIVLHVKKISVVEDENNDRHAIIILKGKDLRESLEHSLTLKVKDALFDQWLLDMGINQIGSSITMKLEQKQTKLVG
jgi:hypothetical protein